MKFSHLPNKRDASAQSRRRSKRKGDHGPIGYIPSCHISLMRLGGPCFLIFVVFSCRALNKWPKGKFFLYTGETLFFFWRRLVLVLSADVALIGKPSLGGSSVMVSL